MRDDHIGAVGALDRLVLLAERNAVLDAHESASTGVAQPGEQVGLELALGAGVPTSERARIQSSYGYTSASCSSVEPEPTWLGGVDLRGVRTQRAGAGPQERPTSSLVVIRWSAPGRSSHVWSNGDSPRSWIMPSWTAISRAFDQSV